ncbi:MAG: hypothetical protein NTY93_00930 [Candidatus Kaiserbacteria bacterium]|nr:hypothetical protein [Candidatus Kaiserbacteria bacterium]
MTTMPDGQKMTRVTHGQVVPSWMLATGKLTLNYEVKGEVTDTQRAAVATVEKAGRKYVRETRNDFISVLSSTILYGIAGYAGGYLGSKAFHGADPQEYGAYAAAATGLAGLANGLVSLGGKTYSFEVFGMQTLDGMFPAYGIKILIKNPY